MTEAEMLPHLVRAFIALTLTLAVFCRALHVYDRVSLQLSGSSRYEDNLSAAWRYLAKCERREMMRPRTWARIFLGLPYRQPLWAYIQDNH